MYNRFILHEKTIIHMILSVYILIKAVSRW